MRAIEIRYVNNSSVAGTTALSPGVHRHMVLGLVSVTYEEKLGELKLESLTEMVHTYKIVHNFDKLEYNEMFTMINEGLDNTRGTRLRADRWLIV